MDEIARAYDRLGLKVAQCVFDESHHFCTEESWVHRLRREHHSRQPATNVCNGLMDVLEDGPDDHLFEFRDVDQVSGDAPESVG